jgi:hypothetical protein
MYLVQGCDTWDTEELIASVTCIIHVQLVKDRKFYLAQICHGV